MGRAPQLARRRLRARLQRQCPRLRLPRARPRERGARDRDRRRRARRERVAEVAAPVSLRPVPRRHQFAGFGARREANRMGRHLHGRSAGDAARLATGESREPARDERRGRIHPDQRAAGDQPQPAGAGALRFARRGRSAHAPHTPGVGRSHRRAVAAFRRPRRTPGRRRRLPPAFRSAAHARGAALPAFAGSLFLGCVVPRALPGAAAARRAFDRLPGVGRRCHARCEAGGRIRGNTRLRPRAGADVGAADRDRAQLSRRPG